MLLPESVCIICASDLFSPVCQGNDATYLKVKEDIIKIIQEALNDICVTLLGYFLSHKLFLGCNVYQCMRGYFSLSYGHIPK